MGFLAELIQTVIKMFFIAAVSFGGIRFGKHLRASKRLENFLARLKKRKSKKQQ